MKRKLQKLLCFVVAMALTFAATACGTSSNGDDSDGRVVKWEVLKAGYGTVPYEKLADAFMEKYPDITVKITFNPNITSTTAARLESKTNIADVYSFASLSSIKRWAAQGWVEPLDDVYDSELSNGKTVRETMTGSATNVCTYNDTAYAIPEYVSISGFVYNKSLFDKYNWEIPETTADLDKLCKQILADTENKVTPLVYCGGAAGGYIYYATNGWYSQYEGISNMDKFFTYESPELFKPSNSKGKMYALQNVKRFFFDQEDYVMAGSEGMTHIVAQSKLIQGEAAMMLNGSWFENEMATILKENPEIELGMFAVPQYSNANGEPLHADGYTTVDDKRVLSVGYGSFYFIPSEASNKEDAKTFLKFLSEPEACEIYTKYTNAIRPFDYELSSDAECYANMSSFGKSIMDIAQQCYLYVPNSTSLISIKGFIGFWPRGSQPEFNIRDGVETVNQTLENDYQYVLKNWDNWQSLIE